MTGDAEPEEGLGRTRVKGGTTSKVESERGALAAGSTLFHDSAGSFEIGIVGLSVN